MQEDAWGPASSFTLPSFLDISAAARLSSLQKEKPERALASTRWQRPGASRTATFHPLPAVFWAPFSMEDSV